MTIHRYTLAILGGTGAEGRGLALRWARAGHCVILGSRNAEKASKTCYELNKETDGVVITFSDYRSAADKAEIVVLTVPYAAQRTTVVEVRDSVSGKILVDATVPLVPPKVSRVQLPTGSSAVAAIQALLGDSVRVVSAFQNVSAHVLRDPRKVAACDVLVCGDDPQAREVVIGLARDLGLRAYHAGPICNSLVAEALTSVLIAINIRYKVSGAGIRITGLPEGTP